MSDLSTIRTMRDLEHQRALLQLKAASEEQQVRQDVADIKRTYTTVTGIISGIRTGVSRFRLIAPIALPILRFFWNRRKRKR